MKHLKLIIGALLLSVLSVSCKDEKDQKEQEGQAEEFTYKPDTLVRINKTVPVSTYSNDSITVKAYDYKGFSQFLNKKNDTTYVVNFWATWCVPCIKELPHFEEINKKYKQNKVKVLLVSLDMHKTINDKLLPFIQSHQLKSDVVVLRDPDADTWIRKIDTTWTGALPATLIYNKDMRKFYEKTFTYNELEKQISNFK